MIKSIFRLMWKRKKRSFLMIAEMFISMLLLFALSAMTINNIYHYNEPIGFDYENVWVLEMDFRGGQKDAAYKKQLIELLTSNIKSIPEVLEISNSSSCLPYSQGARMTTLHYKDKRIGNSNFINTDFHYSHALNLKVSEGRWYSVEDIGKKEIPIVINGKLKNVLFGDGSAIGEVIHSGMYKVVGLVDNYKIKGEFSKKSLVFFRMMKPDEFQNMLLVKTESGAGLAFEEQLTTVATSTAKEWTIKVSKLTEHRATSFKITWIPIIVFSSICGFLIINIIFGLFGILLYNINSRKPEIGLRRSVGATTGKIHQQFMGEMLMLTTMGIIPGIIIAVQFPLLKAFEIEPGIFLLAILGSTVVIYLLVLISSFIPSRYAAKTEPAVALHEK